MNSNFNRNENRMSPEMSNEIEIINKENIFFGHRSVGENIIQGVREIISKNNTRKLVILKMDSINQIPEKYFLDANIGSNGDPKSKINDFNRIVNLLAPKDLNIAMMKLCYADIKDETNLNEVFKYYSSVIDSIKLKYPNLIIIHFTVPFTSQRTFLMSIKDFIKGRPNNSQLDNVARNKYNLLLLSKYSQNEIFDLAKIESTNPNGKREEFNYQGKVYNSLINDYSIDGGHLNEEGRRIIAEKFISYLASRVQQQSFSINK